MKNVSYHTHRRRYTRFKTSKQVASNTAIVQTKINLLIDKNIQAKKSPLTNQEAWQNTVFIKRTVF
jgi:hypothetical protein